MCAGISLQPKYIHIEHIVCAEYCTHKGKEDCWTYQLLSCIAVMKNKINSPCSCMTTSNSTLTTEIALQTAYAIYAVCNAISP